MLPGAHPRELEPFALFLFCGILPWTWFSSSLLESANVLIAGGNLIKKVLFPAEVLPDRVTVLAQIGERAQEIDVQRAERAKQRAEQRLAQAQPQLTQIDFDIERARISLMKSLLRLQVASRARTRV